MMNITLQIDDQRLSTPLSDHQDRLVRYLDDCRKGRATEGDFHYFRDAGITVGIDGFAPHEEVSDLERSMVPLYQAVNTLTAWIEAESVEVKRRWYRLAVEAAMSAIHRTRQGQRGDTMAQWPMDEFLHQVWALATAMHERGVTFNEVWFGQEYARVVQMLETRGLIVVERNLDQPSPWDALEDVR